MSGYWRYLRVMLLAMGAFLLAHQEASASHFAGVDLTYQCVGNNRYVVTLTIYRDCEGVGMSASERISALSDSCGITNLNFTLPRDTFYEVSQLCPPQLSQSACSGGVLPGIQVHIYRDTITLPQTCVDWVLSWTSCCRNSNITNLMNTGSIYVEAGLNSSICNSSPTFTSNPTPYFCAGQCYNYNHGAFDPDNDSLVYALTCPLQGRNNCIPNSAGTSVTSPVVLQPGTTFGFNQFTGQMSFCPIAGQRQQAVAAVTVYQISNGDTIGYVQRDIQMIVLNSTNCTTPVNSGTPNVSTGGPFDSLTNSFVVCAGTSLIFDLILYDPDGDTIRINPNNTNLDLVFGPANWNSFFNTAPPFRPDSAQLFISINAVPANLGVNQFTIGITDGACPVPGDQILSYNLIIPGVEVSARDTTICPGIAQSIPLFANSFSSVGSATDGTFQWSQVSGPTVTFSDDTLRNPIVNIPSNTADGDVIVLTVQFITHPGPSGTQCFTSDTISIFLRNLPLTVFTVPDYSLCPNGEDSTLNFAAGIVGPGIDLVNGVYDWDAFPASAIAHLSDSTINNPTVLVSGGPGDSIVYTLSYTYGLCQGSDDLTLRWRNGIPSVTVMPDTICPGDTTQLLAVLTDSIKVIDPTACSTYTVSPIAFAPISGTGTRVTNFTSNPDDGVSQALPIGFPFEFFCNTYTQFVMSTNGFISFDLGSPQGCCSGQLLPNNGRPNNLIALAWEDLDVENDFLEYFVTGTAPNRILVVNYNGIDHYPGNSTGSNLPITIQLQLYEGSNIIEIHTTSQPDPSGNHTQGIENVDGSIGFAVPGRNGQPWTATNDAFRFTPNQALLTGPFSYNWSPSVLVSDPTAPNPRGFPTSTTAFAVTINEQGCIQSDTVEVVVRTQIPVPTISCGTPANQATSVLFEWGNAPGATGWEYSLDSGITWVAVPLSDSSLLVSGLTNGDCVDFFVRPLGGVLSVCPTNAAAYLQCCTTPCPMPNTSTVTDLTCKSSNNGVLSISVDGGVLGDHPSYSGTLFDTSGTQIGTTISTAAGVSPASLVFNNLPAGVYYAFLTDTLGCFTTSDTVIITEPDTLLIMIDSTTLTTCFADTDGTAHVSAMGGTIAYGYQWDAAANNQITATATNLPRGTYNVTVTDANGCTDVTAVTVNSPFPGLPSIAVNSTPSSSCIGDGTATVFSTFNMVGNANNYTYQWSAGTSSGPTVTGLPSGPVTVTVTDLNGCEAIDTVTVTGSPTISVVNMPVINPGCTLNNGQITAVATGDSVGYSYQWSPNTGGQTTAVVTGLGIGTYSVTITGLSNGCTATGSVTLVNNSALNIIGFNITNPSCGLSDGDVTVLTNGATGALNYAWSNNTSANPLTGVPIGTYIVTVTDPATGCSDIGDTTLVQPSVAATIDQTTILNPSCNLNNGALTVIPAGAPGPFTYAWSDAQTNATAVGLQPNVPYSVTVTYQGCTAVAGPITLTSDTLEIAINDKDDINCNGDLSSYANVAILRGNPANVSFAWSNGATTQNIDNLPAGTYTVTATSGTCQTTQSITVVNVTVSANAWINQSGQRAADIQLNDVINLNGGAVTNFANPVYVWSEEDPTIGTIADSSLNVTTVTGASEGTTWLYFDVQAGVCSARDSVQLTVESYLGMPTAFTPNGDNINDFFQPVGLTMSDKVLEFKIYNRWGQLVYNDATNHSWDGTFQGVPQPQDVYIYVFEYAPDNGERIFIKGEFTLIR